MQQNFSNFEMKHNGTRIFDGTTGPPYSQQTGVHHHLNQNNFTKSVHHLNQPNSSYLHVNSNQINNYHQNSFYLTPNNNSNYYYHYPLHKSLYRINSALNLDHIEFESNLKREFGSVHSIGAISNNCSHLFHNQTNFNNNHNQFHHNENSLSFYSVLKEFKRQNLNNHRNIINSNNKVHEYLKTRREMSNIELVKSNNLNSVNNYEKSPCLNNKSKVSVIDGAYKSNQLGSNDQTNFNLNKSNEINSLSAYSSKSSSILGSNIALDETVIPSLRLKKKIYKLWDNKTDKSIKNKSKMSENTHSSKNENSEYLNGTTKAIFRKFTRIGSSKNVSNNSNSNDPNTATDEYRSLNTAASSTHLDDPEVRFEEKLRKKAFAHYDCQSLTANLSYASRLCHLLSKRRNTTTGASAASMSSKHNLNLDLENGEIDTGDDRSNDLVLSCPYFRNELGGEEERCISLNRFTADQSFKINKSIILHKPNMTSGLALLEDANEKRWKLKCCPYQKFSTISTNNLEQTFLIENSDAGSTYYRNHFYGLEHQNWFGIDENLGPIAISIRRERVPLENCSLKKKLFKSTNENINNPHNSNTASTFSVNSSSSINNSQPNQQTKNQYRIIIRTSELNVLRGTVFEDCVPGLSYKNNNHNNHHAKEILDYIAPEINLSCLKLGVSNADEQLLRLDEQAQTGKYKVGVLYCKAGQSTEEEMYNNETAGPAFEEFLSCLGTRVRLKGFEKYRAGLDNKKDTTGLYSVYSTFADYELMFHVSTLLPYTTDKQQILRKQHIGNDIVTIVFQEPDACQFTPKLIRSHFQHVFIIVKVLPSPNRPPKYSVAISRSKDVPVFGPPIPENGIFTKSKQFTDFLLSKIINAENAAHRSEKFRSMAQRTRHEYLKELAQKFVTNTSINDISGGSSAGSKLVSIFGGSKKSRSSRVGRDCHFIGDAVIKGAICWEMCVEDFGQSKVIDCLVAISSDSLVIIEEKTKELIFTCPNISILGWSSHPNNIKIFYHQGESIFLKCKDPDLDEINEIVNRLKNVTNGCETQEIILKRNNSNQLGFHVGFDGIITHVDMYTYAWQSGLRRYARIVEICKVAIATLSYEQMQDLLKTSITVSITILPQLNEHTPRRGCNLQTCSYVTNPMAFSNTSSNYENINNVFDRFVKNQQTQMQNQNNQPKGFLNVSNSLNYNQTVNSNQHQIMGLPSNNNIPSRTNCSSPFSNSSIASKNSTNATGISLNSNGLSRSKTMLDSSTSSSKKSNLNFMCSVPSTPTMMNSLIPFSYKQNNSVQAFGKNSLISSGLATSSIASSIQDSLNQLSLSTTSSQTNHTHVNQNVECLDLGIPTEPIKINLPASKQTSDYNSDTSSSNEWYSNTWSLENGNSQNKNGITDKKQQNSNFFHQTKIVKKLNNENQMNTVSNNINSSKNVLNSLSTNIKNDKKNNLVETNNSALIRNNYCSVRQQNLLNNRKSNLVNTNATKNSTLQEDLLKLINPDSYTLDNRDNLSELVSNSSNPASNESSNTQYSTPYSSLERSITSCSNKEIINENQKEDDILIVAQPAKVISFENNENLEKNVKTNSLSLSNNEKNYNKKETRNLERKSFLDSEPNSNLDWPSLINNANKAIAVTQQALKTPSPNSNYYNRQNFDSSKKLSESSKSNFENQTELFSNRENIANYSSFMSKSTSNLNSNSLDEWIKEFENFSENAVNLFTDTNEISDGQINKLNLSNDEEVKMKNLEECLKKAQNDLDKEKSSKMTLEEQVKHLRQENQRLHKESQTTAAQLRKFTEWFFQNINAK